MITVVRAGPLTTVQDLGRPGFAHLGVPRSGALDVPALCRANQLVGNPVSAAGLETTLMGCALRFEVDARVAVVGAVARLRVDREPVTADGVIAISAGSVLEVGRAAAGVRSYVAVAGGIDVEPVLGSRSTDTLSGLGPPQLTDATTLPVGARSSTRVAALPSAHLSPEAGAAAEVAAEAEAGAGEGGQRGGSLGERGVLELGVWLGPREDWVESAVLFRSAYTVSPVSNRVGCRLAGQALSRTQVGELPSEGVVLGAVQVPPDGQPLVFLADHPTTGGYPVVGVVDDVAGLAQARPGTMVRFRALD